jgi:hypothetical protein
MKKPQHPVDTVEITVADIVCSRFFMVVVSLLGREHVLSYDDASIGANESGGGFTLILPRVVALQEGLCDA